MAFELTYPPMVCKTVLPRYTVTEIFSILALGRFRSKPHMSVLHDNSVAQPSLSLVRWSEKWQMLLHFGKCKCLYTGPGKTGMNYEMGGTILSKTVTEKDLWVTLNANMKVSELHHLRVTWFSE